MVNENLIAYIKAAQAEGMGKDTIVSNLKSGGWIEGDIYEAFGYMSLGQMPVAMPSPMSHSQFGNTELSRESIHSDEINSPYSILLAIVLTVSLFIITNKFFTDIKSTFSADVGSTLLIDGFFVLPFLLVAFFLHHSFLEYKKRFHVLSLPYFIISGWLLVRLLIKVAMNILDNNAVFGIYIVLIMIIAVLTGIIFFVQRYIRN